MESFIEKLLNKVIILFSCFLKTRFSIYFKTYPLINNVYDFNDGIYQKM